MEVINKDTYNNQIADKINKIKTNQSQMMCITAYITSTSLVVCQEIFLDKEILNNKITIKENYKKNYNQCRIKFLNTIIDTFISNQNYVYIIEYFDKLTDTEVIKDNENEIKAKQYIIKHIIELAKEKNMELLPLLQKFDPNLTENDIKDKEAENIYNKINENRQNFKNAVQEFFSKNKIDKIDENTKIKGFDNYTQNDIIKAVAEIIFKEENINKKEYEGLQNNILKQLFQDFNSNQYLIQILYNSLEEVNREKFVEKIIDIKDISKESILTFFTKIGVFVDTNTKKKKLFNTYKKTLQLKKLEYYQTNSFISGDIENLNEENIKAILYYINDPNLIESKTFSGVTIKKPYYLIITSEKVDENSIEIINQFMKEEKETNNYCYTEIKNKFLTKEKCGDYFLNKETGDIKKETIEYFIKQLDFEDVYKNIIKNKIYSNCVDYLITQEKNIEEDNNFLDIYGDEPKEQLILILHCILTLSVGHKGQKQSDFYKKCLTKFLEFSTQNKQNFDEALKEYLIYLDCTTNRFTTCIADLFYIDPINFKNVFDNFYDILKLIFKQKTDIEKKTQFSAPTDADETCEKICSMILQMGLFRKHSEEELKSSNQQIDIFKQEIFIKEFVKFVEMFKNRFSEAKEIFYFIPDKLPGNEKTQELQRKQSVTQEEINKKNQEAIVNFLKLAYDVDINEEQAEKIIEDISKINLLGNNNITDNFLFIVAQYSVKIFENLTPEQQIEIIKLKVQSLFSNALIKKEDIEYIYNKFPNEFIDEFFNQLNSFNKKQLKDLNLSDPDSIVYKNIKAFISLIKDNKEQKKYFFEKLNANNKKKYIIPLLNIFLDEKIDFSNTMLSMTKKEKNNDIQDKLINACIDNLIEDIIDNNSNSGNDNQSKTTNTTEDNSDSSDNNENIKEEQISDTTVSNFLLILKHFPNETIKAFEKKIKKNKEEIDLKQTIRVSIEPKVEYFNEQQIKKIKSNRILNKFLEAITEEKGNTLNSFFDKLLEDISELSMEEIGFLEKADLIKFKQKLKDIINGYGNKKNLESQFLIDVNENLTYLYLNYIDNYQEIKQEYRNTIKQAVFIKELKNFTENNELNGKKNDYTLLNKLFNIDKDLFFQFFIDKINNEFNNNEQFILIFFIKQNNYDNYDIFYKKILNTDTLQNISKENLEFLINLNPNKFLKAITGKEETEITLENLTEKIVEYLINKEEFTKNDLELFINISKKIDNKEKQELLLVQLFNKKYSKNLEQTDKKTTNKQVFDNLYDIFKTNIKELYNSNKFINVLQIIANSKNSLLLYDAMNYFVTNKKEISIGLTKISGDIGVIYATVNILLNQNKNNKNLSKIKEDIEKLETIDFTNFSKNFFGYINEILDIYFEKKDIKYKFYDISGIAKKALEYSTSEQIDSIFNNVQVHSKFNVEELKRRLIKKLILNINENTSEIYKNNLEKYYTNTDKELFEKLVKKPEKLNLNICEYLCKNKNFEKFICEYFKKNKGKIKDFKDEIVIYFYNKIPESKEIIRNINKKDNKKGSVSSQKSDIRIYIETEKKLIEKKEELKVKKVEDIEKLNKDIKQLVKTYKELNKTASCIEQNSLKNSLESNKNTKKIRERGYNEKISIISKNENIDLNKLKINDISDDYLNFEKDTKGGKRPIIKTHIKEENKKITISLDEYPIEFELEKADNFSIIDFIDLARKDGLVPTIFSFIQNNYLNDSKMIYKDKSYSFKTDVKNICELANSKNLKNVVNFSGKIKEKYYKDLNKTINESKKEFIDTKFDEGSSKIFFSF